MDNSRRISSIIALMLALTANFAAHAASFTYDVNYFGMTGNIVASCDACPLNSSDVTSWMLNGNGLSFSSQASDAQLVTIGSELQATPTAVTFAFTPSNFPDQSIFFGNGESLQLLTFPTPASEGGLDLGEVDACIGSSYITGSEACSAQAQIGKQVIATRTPVSAPELDTRTFIASLTLLCGATAVLCGRRVALSRASSEEST